MDLTVVSLIAQIATPIICGGAIPFIMKVNSRLAVIETKLEAYANQSQEMAKMSERIHKLELEQVRIKTS